MIDRREPRRVTNVPGQHTWVGTEGDPDWVVAFDPTIVRDHQHVAGARSVSRPALRSDTRGEPG